VFLDIYQQFFQDIKLVKISRRVGVSELTQLIEQIIRLNSKIKIAKCDIIRSNGVSGSDKQENYYGSHYFAL